MHKYRTLRRGISWELGFKEFRDLIERPCHYCNKPPSNKWHNHVYSGIDRKDSNIGYTPENCVPCCKDCNYMKGNRLTEDEMKVVAIALAAYRLTKI